MALIMLMTQELTTTEKSSECKPVHKALLRVDAPIREVPERHRDRILRHLLALDERDTTCALATWPTMRRSSAT